MPYDHFDLTPDPNVLIALTQTPLRQMDALCELIDNSIDSFSAALRQGITIDNPTISLFIPKISEVNKGNGAVIIMDNGPGLSPEAAEKALRAGYSSNNQYDNLGLFGMGFNISTGKIGSITTLTTASKDADKALKVVIDLNEMNQNKSYTVIPEEHDKTFAHGTVIEIRGWWPEGNSNNGFIKTLARYSTEKIVDEIGRRYSTYLRDKKVQISVNKILCKPHEFCVWGANRHVTRKKYGEIPARFDLDSVIFTQRKCQKCGTTIEDFQRECPACGCNEIRTIEERIKGWVGIQRYDSPTDYGIDLIRNGRAIRVAERSAFFDFTDEFNKTVHDYPIDSPYGRIVGEIHLDHVPVDFLKRDFQRSTPEWQRAMSFLRGDSSLQPNQPGADKNNSPIFKLFQGYRKVRDPGVTDMYMGYWDAVNNKPHRISREVEEDFIKRFLNKEPGYYDDAKWWEKVEEADRPPIPEIPVCPQCGMQIMESDETCAFCGFILKSKKCVYCNEKIPFSAKNCPCCGKPQDVEILKPWKCDVCGKNNAAENEICSGCGQPKGTINLLSIDYLKDNSNREDSLSIDSCSVVFPDGVSSSPIKVNTYIMKKQIQANLLKESIPIYTFKTEIGSVDIFVDAAHKIFTNYHVPTEMLVATEIADRIKALSGAGHDVESVESVPMIAWQIVEKYWSDHLEQTIEIANAEILAIFKTIRERLAMTIGNNAADYFEEMTDDQKKTMAENIINSGKELSSINLMKENGDYLLYVGHEFILRLFELRPEFFFDGKVWREKFTDKSTASEIIAVSQRQIAKKYRICLDDVVSFLDLKISDPLFVKKTMTAIDFLKRKIIQDVY